jgi:hypothetical protein
MDARELQSKGGCLSFGPVAGQWSGRRPCLGPSAAGTIAKEPTSSSSTKPPACLLASCLAAFHLLPSQNAPSDTQRSLFRIRRCNEASQHRLHNLKMVPSPRPPHPGTPYPTLACFLRPPQGFSGCLRILEVLKQVVTCITRSQSAHFARSS